MYQFINKNHIEKVHLTPRHIAILRMHGWKFIYISPKNTSLDLDLLHAYSCVNLSKQAVGINSIFIQTPYALYKHLVKK